MKSSGHVTIEKTAKRYKLLIALSVLGLLAGVFWFVVELAKPGAISVEPNFTPPAILFAISAIVYLFTKIAIWWNHG